MPSFSLSSLYITIYKSLNLSQLCDELAPNMLFPKVISNLLLFLHYDLPLSQTHNSVLLLYY